MSVSVFACFQTHVCVRTHTYAHTHIHKHILVMHGVFAQTQTYRLTCCFILCHVSM